MTSSYKMVGGNLGLDFHNTVSWRAGVTAGDEKILTYRDLLDWGREAGTLSEREHEDLRQEAERRPESAAAVVEWAKTLRMTLERVFAAVAEERAPKAADLDAFNGVLAQMPLKLLARSPGVAFGWGWSGEGGDLKQVLWPVVWSAATLLNSAGVARIKACPANGCGWLFADESRRRNRKWCDMRDCGNREKARRHYRRHRVV
jgi:predicted RNA-binding Zn ribbon-like protein